MIAQPLNITTTNDLNGNPIVLLPLKNRTKEVIVDPTSFKELIELGIKFPLLMYKGFPSIHSMNGKKRKYIRIARLIAGAARGEMVLCADNDRFNLRKENLIITKGGSGKKDTIIPRDIKYQISYRHVPGRVTLNSFNFL